MLRLPAQRPAFGLAVIPSPATDAYVDTSDMFDVVCQLLDRTLLASVVDTGVADDLADLDNEPPRPFPDGLASGDFAAFVDVPRDFFVGGSSRVACIEFRFPWDGLLLFSDLERLLEPLEDWLDRDGELFTVTLRRSPIVALAIIPGYI